MTAHDLKCWPGPFRALLEGVKKFEIREDDRGYQVGDILVLREWLPNDPNVKIGEHNVPGAYSGEVLHRRVTYLSRIDIHGAAEFVVMSLEDA